MSLTTETKQIGAHTYEVTQLNAIKGRGVFVRFVKLIAPAADALADTGNADQNARLAKALASVVANITDEDMNFFCEAFAPATCLVVTDDNGKTRRPGLKDLFALHFASNYGDMMAWLYFCLEVNFGSFFAAAGLRRATSETPAESK